MTDWDQLREIGPQVTPPPFESLVTTAGRRTRRTRIITATVALTVLAALGGGLWLAGDDDVAVQPAKTPPDGPTLPDGVLALPEDDSEDIALEEGRYQIPLSDTLAFEIDLERGTTAFGEGLYLETAEGIIKVEAAGEGYGVPNDPCASQFVQPVGPAVADLVDAIRKAPVYQVTRPRPTEIGGAEGTYIEIRIPAGYNSASCVNGQVGLPGNPETSNNMASGYAGSWWILDVDGQRVVVTQLCEQCEDTADDRVAQTVQSITFTPTS